MDRKLRKKVRLRRCGQLAGGAKVTMTESNYYQKISAYLAENKRKTALEAEIQNMAFKAIGTKAKNKAEIASPEGNNLPPPNDGQTSTPMDQRLDAIYDQEPLGFEKDPESTNVKMLAQDPLEEVNIGDEVEKRVTYISAKDRKSTR